MKLLEKAIKEKGVVLDGNVLKVGAFFNHQMDVKLLTKLGKDVHKHFIDCEVTKILTVEASGIGLSCLTAQFFNCNVVFAKKSKTSNVTGNVYSADCYSYTHDKLNTLIVPKEYLSKDDKILIVDDFLARGEAVNSLTKIVNLAGAELVGVAIGIEKGFQGAGDKLRKQGVNLYSGAIIDKMTEKRITFRKN